MLPWSREAKEEMGTECWVPGSPPAHISSSRIGSSVGSAARSGCEPDAGSRWNYMPCRCFLEWSQAVTGVRHSNWNMPHTCEL